jgi:rhodanese-related sulfurtransferase
VAERAHVDALLDAARERIERVAASDLDREIAAGTLVVDLRPQADRDADGEIPGAVAVEMIHLQWRLDPTSPHRLPGVTSDTRAVLVCNEGFASSLAAASVKDLGLADCADLAGGARAWLALRRPAPAGARAAT